jgi:hypothetical protein
LKGDWVLAPAAQQEGGATKKGPAAKIIGTDNTAMSFKLVGKGTTVQESLLPDTPKEMVTMYHCKDKTCNTLAATHYCAKKNQPQLQADTTLRKKIVMNCDMNSELCTSGDGHVHRITHEVSDDGNRLKTTYTIFQDGKHQKNSVYHFVRK